MSTKTILCFAGSARKQSMNKQLAKQAADIANTLNAVGHFLDLADYPMPIYNGDDEAAHSLPENALKLKAMMAEADGYLIVSPEYNSSFSPLLKNTLDWVSRSHEENEAPMAAYRGKFAGIASASPGRLGGLRGLPSVRLLLSNMGVTVVSHQLAVGQANSKIDVNGQYNDEDTLKSLEKIIRQMISIQL